VENIFKGLFNREPPNLLGVDISSTAVKILQLSCQQGDYQVEHYGVAPLPQHAVIDKEIKDSASVAESVRLAVQRAGCTTAYAAVAVPDSSVITRVISLDKDLTGSEIEAQVVLEAEKYIPYPIHEVNIDFEVLGPCIKGNNLIDILVVASHTKNVDSRVDALAEGGLTAKVMDVESYGLERAFSLIAPKLSLQGVEQVVAIIDIGATLTTLTVLKNHSTIFTRSEAFGGQQLTKEIQQRFGLSYAEAGLAKKQGKLPPEYKTEVLNPFKESAVLQVRRALQFFFSTNQGTEVRHIVLAGGTSQVEGLAKMIHEQIGIPTSVANPFIGMTLSPSVNATALMKDAPSLMVSVGLALRSFEGATKA
jgi:type IV pilus assembly protein PilM